MIAVIITRIFIVYLVSSNKTFVNFVYNISASEAQGDNGNGYIDLNFNFELVLLSVTDR